jgi:hypothetical protein
MPSITADLNAPAKILLIGKSGAGKTGSLASLVAAGYNLRIIDTDKGVRTLRSLLMDSEHYPYAKIIGERGYDLNRAVRYVPIDTAMKLQTIVRKMPGTERSTSERLLAPVDAKAWMRAIEIMSEWDDGELNLGHVSTWGLQDVLVIDSFSTLAKCAYYFSQAMNGRLGARDQGYDYQRDVGEAQSQLTRLLELLYDSGVACNVIVVSHITWVDESQGVASKPRTSSADGKEIIISNPDGYPSAIGRALSPQMSKYFNDVYIVRSEGSGNAVRRTICTVPNEGVLAKHSVYLERDYPISYGMGEIFARLRGQEPPTDLIEACKSTRREAPPAGAEVAPGASSKLVPKSAVRV